MTKVADIMTSEVVTVRSSAKISAAISLIQQRNIQALIVDKINDSDAYGIVTAGDIVAKVIAFGKDPSAVRVFEVMTKPCIVVPPDLGVEYVARLFAQARLRRAPVVEGRLLGVVSITDILRKSDFVEKPKRLFIEDEIEVAREEARRSCAEKGATAPACAAAWDVVEELQATAAHQRQG